MDTSLASALCAHDASTRLRAALAAGSDPDVTLIDILLARCAIESDFYVRDMLTWALTRFPPDLTLPKLLAELSADGAQARSQALHTLSKIRDVRAWPAITRSLLRDADDEVARSAWRAAVVLVPDARKGELAQELASQLGRGDQRMHLSLSRALIGLGAAEVEPVLRMASASADPAVRAHVSATERLLRDPDAAFELDVEAARRTFVLAKQR